VGGSQELERDVAGRAFLPLAGRVLTTTQGAERLGDNATGLEPWSSVEASGPDGRRVTVTAVPAQHGPDGTDHITGPVIGFVLSADGLQTVYVSGDNASLDVVREIAQRTGAVDVAVLFAGAVSVPTASTAPTSRCRASAPPRRRRSSAPAPSCRCTSRAGPTSPRGRPPRGVRRQPGRRPAVLLERGEKMGQTPHDDAPDDA
jgi:hypothetical protein